MEITLKGVPVYTEDFTLTISFKRDKREKTDADSSDPDLNKSLDSQRKNKLFTLNLDSVDSVDPMYEQVGEVEENLDQASRTPLLFRSPVQSPRGRSESIQYPSPASSP